MDALWIGAGLGALYLLVRKPSTTSEGKVELAAPREGATYYGDVNQLEKIGEISQGGDSGKKDVAGDVDDKETPWFELEKPLTRMDVFYRQFHLPASKLDISDIGPEIWDLVGRALAAPGAMKKTKPDGNQLDPWDDYGDPIEPYRVFGDVVHARGGTGSYDADAALIFAQVVMGIAYVVLKVIGLITGYDLSNMLSSAQASIEDAKKANYEHQKALEDAAKRRALIPAQFQPILRAVWDRGDVITDLDGLYNWFDERGEIHHFNEQFYPGPIQTNRGTIPNEEKPTKRPLALRYGPNGEPFYIRTGAFLPGVPWICDEFGGTSWTVNLPMRARVNRWARIYKALDIMSCLIFPYEDMQYNADDGLWYAKRPSPYLYAYSYGSLGLIGSVFPPSAGCVEIQGHSGTYYDYQMQEAHTNVVQSSAQLLSEVASTPVKPVSTITGLATDQRGILTTVAWK